MTSQQIKRISLRSLQGPLKYWYLIVLLDIYDVRRWYAFDFLCLYVFFFLGCCCHSHGFVFFFFCACVTIFVRSKFPEPEEEVQRDKNDKNRSLSPVSCCPTSARLSTTCQICLSSDTYWTSHPPFLEHPWGITQALVSVMTPEVWIQTLNLYLWLSKVWVASDWVEVLGC